MTSLSVSRQTDKYLEMVRHDCSLFAEDMSGLPKLPPNAPWMQKFCRQMRKLFLLSPSHYKCKTLFKNKSSVLAERKRHAMSPYFYVIHPLSKFCIVLQVMFFLLWFYEIVWGSLRVFVESDNESYTLTQVELVFPYQLIVMLLLFNVGYIDRHTKQVVIESRKIVRRYLKSFFFFDFMATYCVTAAIEYMFQMNILRYSKSSHKDFILAMFIVRSLACCVRINTLFNFLNELLINLRFVKEVRLIIEYVGRTFIYLHLSAFLLYVIPLFIYKGRWPHSSWLYQAKIDENTYTSHKYFESFLLATYYFFGISYSYDISLISEEICVIVISFWGRLYTLFLLADVLTEFSVVGISESTYEKMMRALQQYMIENNIPDLIRHRMLKYYEFKFQRHYFKENEILRSLSEHLRTELFLFGARKLVQKVEIFKRLPSSTLGAIIATMKSETYSPGDIIVKLGAAMDTIYFISTGTVAVLNMNGIELCHLEDGDLFGSDCLVLKNQIYAVVTVETTEVFSISKEDFMGFLLPHHDMQAAFLKSVERKLNRMKQLENIATTPKIDVYSELQKGHILEDMSKRLKED